MSHDVGADIEEERLEILQAVPGVFDFRNYYAIKYQHSHLDGLVARHPDKAETFSIGTSYEGRDMKVRTFHFSAEDNSFYFLISTSVSSSSVQ